MEPNNITQISLLIRVGLHGFGFGLTHVVPQYIDGAHKLLLMGQNITEIPLDPALYGLLK